MKIIALNESQFSRLLEINDNSIENGNYGKSSIPSRLGAETTIQAKMGDGEEDSDPKSPATKFPKSITPQQWGSNVKRKSPGPV